jgi:hypothetical protein
MALSVSKTTGSPPSVGAAAACERAGMVTASFAPLLRKKVSGARAGTAGSSLTPIISRKAM